MELHKMIFRITTTNIVDISTSAGYISPSMECSDPLEFSLPQWAWNCHNSYSESRGPPVRARKDRNVGIIMLWWKLKEKATTIAVMAWQLKWLFSRNKTFPSQVLHEKPVHTPFIYSESLSVIRFWNTRKIKTGITNFLPDPLPSTLTFQEWPVFSRLRQCWSPYSHFSGFSIVTCFASTTSSVLMSMGDCRFPSKATGNSLCQVPGPDGKIPLDFYSHVKQQLCEYNNGKVFWEYFQ